MVTDRRDRMPSVTAQRFQVCEERRWNESWQSFTRSATLRIAPFTLDGEVFVAARLGKAGVCRSSRGGQTEDVSVRGTAHLTERKMPEGYRQRPANNAARFTRSGKAATGEPTSARHIGDRSFDAQPRAWSQHRRALANAPQRWRTRRPCRETPRGLGQAASGCQPRFRRADRLDEPDARASPDPDARSRGRLAEDGVAFISHERIGQHVCGRHARRPARWMLDLRHQTGRPNTIGA